MFLKNEIIEEHFFAYPALQGYVPEIKDKLTDILKRNKFSYRDLNNMLIVIDEACSNVIRHAYKDMDTGDIKFEIIVKRKGVYITIIDKGRTFDWKSFKTPDLNHYVNIGKKGGLGVWIIRKLTDKSSYAKTERGNEIRLVKHHSKPSIGERIGSFIASSKGVREKFVLSATLLILMIVAGIYFYFIYHEREAIKHRFMSSCAETVKSVAESSKESMIKNNYLPLIRMLREIKSSNPGISSVFVMNTEHRIFAHNNSAALHSIYRPAEEPSGEFLVGKVMVLSFRDRYEFVEPIIFRNEDLGEARLVVPHAAVLKVMAGRKTNVLFITALVFAVGALGIYLLMGMITRPMKRLREGVLAIGEGRLDHRIELEGEDEFSQIARAFNDMAGKFRGAQESLVEQERFQKEIQVAKEIQHTLLPKEMPDTGGFDIASMYRSAKEVGGDYYDIMNIGPNLLGVIVADVAGKGVPGSLVMTITRTVVRLVALQNKSAKSVMTKVNSFIKDDMKKGMFVTAFYLVLDSVSRKINFASAGHDPLILYRAKEEKIYYIKPKGFPLGIALPDDELFKKVMVEENVKLAKDDMIVVYTDGIPEAMNGRREQYGEKRFVECIKKYGKLSAGEFIENLNRELAEFTQGYPQNDDISVVAIKEKRTERNAINRITRQVEKMRKKKMKIKDIERKLGVNLKALRAVKAGRITEKKMKFMTFVIKKELMRMIIANPEWNTRRYAKELSDRTGENTDFKLVEKELKRVNLTSVMRRKLYSKERGSETGAKDSGAEKEKTGGEDDGKGGA